MPVDNSIQWKPVRDAHYVLASLHPGGGRQDTFIEQGVLVHLQNAARSVLGRYTFGVLVGQRFDCPVTRSRYAVISSLIEGGTIELETALAAGFHQLLSRVHEKPRREVLGSYCTGESQGARLSGAHVDVNTTWLTEPWHVAVVVAEAATSGAIYRHDARDARWYQAPFYELTSPVRGSSGSKPTCISWPDYMTTDAVVALERAHAAASDRRKIPHAKPQSQASTPNRSLWRSWLPSAPSRRTVEGTGISRTPTATPAPPAHRVPSVSPSAAMSTRPRLPSPNKRSEIVSDADDTATLDTPERYLELARSEGFFITAKFDATDPDTRETVWVLNEPYSGFLLTMVTSDRQVIDASLHYNLHAEDVEVLNATFPEHRDLRSRTVYMREWCVDRLRARCRRLRAAGTLQRDWSVTPTLYLLTPAEWESETLTGAITTADDLETLNWRRIDLLPEAVRRQFRLAPRPERRAKPEAEEHAG